MHKGKLKKEFQSDVENQAANGIVILRMNKGLNYIKKSTSEYLKSALVR